MKNSSNLAILVPTLNLFRGEGVRHKGRLKTFSCFSLMRDVNFFEMVLKFV